MGITSAHHPKTHCHSILLRHSCEQTKTHWHMVQPNVNRTVRLTQALESERESPDFHWFRTNVHYGSVQWHALAPSEARAVQVNLSGGVADSVRRDGVILFSRKCKRKWYRPWPLFSNLKNHLGIKMRGTCYLSQNFTQN